MGLLAKAERVKESPPRHVAFWEDGTRKATWAEFNMGRLFAGDGNCINGRPLTVECGACDRAVLK